MSSQTSGLGFTGQSVKRVEDERFLVGEGTFVADLNVAGQLDGVLHAAFVRSPFPHAEIVSIDVSAASQLPGVHRVFTGAEINEVTNPFPPFISVTDVYSPLYMCMSSDKVRHVGDPVALVIAESRAIAEDAVELVHVEWNELQGIGTMDQAITGRGPAVWEKSKLGNIVGNTNDVYGDVDDVFANADEVVTMTFDSHRQSNQPMETRGSLILVDPDDGHLTIHNTSQAPHFLKWAVAGMTATESGPKQFAKFLQTKDRREAFFGAAKSFVKDQWTNIKAQDNSAQKLQMATENPMPHMMRMGMNLLAAEDYPTVKAIDIGGGFGSKGPVAREDIALAAAAKRMGRSVQWIEDRVENLLNGGQAREERFTMSIAVDADGTFRGLKCDAVLDMGAYPAFPVSPALIKQLWKVYMPGPYKWDAFQLTTKIVATNKGTVVPYRGPWANETYARERIIDAMCDQLGLDPAEVRQRNIFREADFPTSCITGPDFDSTMTSAATLDRAMELIDMDEIAAMKAAAEGTNHRIGFGVATYHEAAPGPANFFDSMSPGSGMFTAEPGRATVTDEGRIVMYTSQSPHGQSHQTTYKQVVADEFGVAMEDVDVVWGNTDQTQFSFLGTGGSRGGPMGGGVMRMSAREIRQEIVDIAADMLEASVDDIEIVHGNIHVAGVPARGITYKDVAQKAKADKGITDGPVFESVMNYGGAGNGGWSCATHVAVVDVDLDTGLVSIPKYLVVEDCGRIINPAVVDGQIRGGVAQGIGAVFYEKTAYDADANMQASTYMDYLVPTAMEIPEIQVEHMETITGGDADSRGTGEGGMIGAPAVLTNAVSDALGVQVTEQYLPPYRVLELAGVIDPD